MNASKLNKILALTRSGNQNESEAACRMLCKALNESNYIFSEPNDSAKTYQSQDYKPPNPPKDRVKKRKKITNKYETYCRICQEHIPVGIRVYWAPGEGVTHISCGDFSAE
jgi:hypothetical protein